MAEVLKPFAQKSVAVIGGGIAGLSAAANLIEQGISVTLFEAAPQPGGRARRVNFNNLALDNGQHILLGAYHQTLALLSLVGISETSVLLRQPLSLHIYGAMRLKTCSYLPAPLHLLISFCFATGLNFGEKLKLIRFFIWLKSQGFKISKDLPLLDFLDAYCPSPKLTQTLWEPLCLAALNTPIQQASTQVFLNVLRDSFNNKKNDSDLLLPKTDLSSALAEPIASYIRSKGGLVMCNQAINKVEQSKHGFRLKSKSEQTFNFSHVIIATSPAHAENLGVALSMPVFSYQPIYTVYLQYPAETKLPRIMTGFCNKLSQWIFDRGALCSQTGLMSVVISAKGQHQDLTQTQLAETVVQELASAFPELPPPLWHKVIAEKRATFSCTTALKRPAIETTIPNLYLAGDYVTSGCALTEYPATIEGAVRSGLACAAKIARQTQAKS